jgi:hypothetical protein
MRRAFARGAALVETALVMSVVMLIMLASINLATIGFYQMSADAAAFFDAHASALRRSCSPTGTVGSSIFTRIPLASFSCTTIAGQNWKMPVTGYRPFGDADPTHVLGGYSIVQGSQIRTTVDATAASIGLLPGGLKAPILGQAFEPQFDEYGVHYNADTNQSGSLSWFTNRVDYFTGGENTPPYFVGSRIMRMCGDTLFGTGTTAPSHTGAWVGAPEDNYVWVCKFLWFFCSWVNQPIWNPQDHWDPNAGASVPGTTYRTSTPWSACTHVYWHGLGLAEYLDTDNWGNTNPGVGPVGAAGSPQATFQWAQCHQQLYVQFAQMLATNYAAALPATTDDAYNDFNPTLAGSLLESIYDQDAIQATDTPVDFSVPVGSFPTHPESGC